MVVNHDPDVGTEFLHYPPAEAIGHCRRISKVKHRINLGVGPIRVLPAGPSRGHEVHLDLIFGDDPTRRHRPREATKNSPMSISRNAANAASSCAFTWVRPDSRSRIASRFTPITVANRLWDTWAVARPVSSRSSMSEWVSLMRSPYSARSMHASCARFAMMTSADCAASDSPTGAGTGTDSMTQSPSDQYRGRVGLFGPSPTLRSPR